MVSRRTAVAIAAPFAIAYAWCVAATVIFCAGIRHPEFLAFPYLQWFEAVSLFRLIGWTARLWIVIAAVFPSVAVLIGVTAFVRYKRTPVRQREMKDKPLYGDRRLATERDLRAGNMNYR
jgi:hypothetical protein